MIFRISNNQMHLHLVFFVCQICSLFSSSYDSKLSLSLYITMRSFNTNKTFFKFKSFNQLEKIVVNTFNLFTQSSFTIVSENNNDEISSEFVIFSDNVVLFHMSFRDKFAIATFQEKFRKRKSFAMINVDDIENSKKIRALNRIIR